MTRKLPSARLLRRLIEYNPQTGEMWWKKRPVWMFAARPNRKAAACHSWNKRYAGKPCLTAKGHDGYRFGSVLGKYHKAHRILFALHYGEWPEVHIDHINGVRDDNRIENLRSVTRSENQKNMARPSDNTTGVVGVYWFRRSSRWVAHITAEKKTEFLGYFDCKSDAIAARKAAERKHGFHPNHGRA